MAKQLDVNRATVEELEQIEGIDIGRARIIVSWREDHGPFSSWADLVAIPGIGPTLLEKVRAVAVLGDGAGPVVAPAERESVEVASNQLTALVALAGLDIAAAAAYEVAIKRVEIVEVRRMLEEFRGDHLRHVSDLNRIITDMGGREVREQVSPTEDSALLTLLTGAMSAFGNLAAITATISNERLTNATYEAALVLPLDEPARRVVAHNFADERRHLSTLLETLRVLAKGEARPHV